MDKQRVQIRPDVLAALAGEHDAEIFGSTDRALFKIGDWQFSFPLATTRLLTPQWPEPPDGTLVRIEYPWGRRPEFRQRSDAGIGPIDNWFIMGNVGRDSWPAVTKGAASVTVVWPREAGPAS